MTIVWIIAIHLFFSLFVSPRSLQQKMIPFWLKMLLLLSANLKKSLPTWVSLNQYCMFIHVYYFAIFSLKDYSLQRLNLNIGTLLTSISLLFVGSEDKIMALASSGVEKTKAQGLEMQSNFNITSTIVFYFSVSAPNNVEEKMPSYHSLCNQSCTQMSAPNAFKE